MLVVVTIIGLFVALVGPRLWSNVDKAKAVKARADIEGLMGALGTYKLDNGNFPTTEQGLAALRTKPADAAQWAGPYTEKEFPRTRGVTITSISSPASMAIRRTLFV
jgi:general secretion pathway protein G